MEGTKIQKNIILPGLSKKAWKKQLCKKRPWKTGLEKKHLKRVTPTQCKKQLFEKIEKTGLEKKNWKKKAWKKTA